MQQYEREVFGSQPATFLNIPFMTNSNSLMMLLPPHKTCRTVTLLLMERSNIRKITS